MATIHDLPDVILSNIFSAILDVRSRNAVSFVCRKWLILERCTRTSLSLRANAQNLYMVPIAFRSVSSLDLSFISPWGHPLLAQSTDPVFLSMRIRQAFPLVSSLTVYARTPLTLQLLAVQWPQLTHVKLVRWHPRPPMPLGLDFVALFENCKMLSSLDLSSFYYWPEDLPPVLREHGDVAVRITKLNLMTMSFTEGFKEDEIREIVTACPNLEEFLVACMFDPRRSGFVGDETLAEIVSKCSKLRILHLVDATALSDCRADPDEERYSSEDAGVSGKGLVEFFSGLPLIEELVLDVRKNVRQSGSALEWLSKKCPNLRSLKLGHFHGITLAIGSPLDGVALCQQLRSLSIKNCADLNDMGLIAIARGCFRLTKLDVEGCKLITDKGMRTMACLLRKTLIEVKISACKNLDAAASLRALEPIRDRIQRLHIDCVWNGEENTVGEEKFGCTFDLNELEEKAIDEEEADNEFYNTGGYDCSDEGNRRKRFKYSSDLGFDLNELEEKAIDNEEPTDNEFINTGGYDSSDEGIRRKRCKSTSDLGFGHSNNGDEYSWERLRYLSLWIEAGEPLSPLSRIGLEDCPNLEEIRIKVEGDCRERPKPSDHAFGLASLACYPALEKMQLDCSEAVGYALTAPSGSMDLSLWERFYLKGVGLLSLSELDYWPPQDKDVNQRGLSLPAAGLLSECVTLRKLFIHGTTHEHFMRFFLNIPNLRDVQLREDYYAAPENDMSTEMRVDSCSRFEDALNSRMIID